MKDMSEEKDEAGEIARWAYERFDLSEGQARSLKDRIKSLESRLQQYEKTDCHCGQSHRLLLTCKDLESRLKEAQEENKVWVEASKDWAVVGQRLSQAEAEKAELIRVADVLQKTINETRKRLSHLMDVAGKMAGALEDVVDADLLGGGLLEKVSISIAEWDGIKKEGV